MYSLIILDIVTTESDALDKMPLPPPEGGGELLFADVL